MRTLKVRYARLVEDKSKSILRSEYIRRLCPLSEASPHNSTRQLRTVPLFKMSWQERYLYYDDMFFFHRHPHKKSRPFKNIEHSTHNTERPGGSYEHHVLEEYPTIYGRHMISCSWRAYTYDYTLLMRFVDTPEIVACSWRLLHAAQSPFPLFPWKMHVSSGAQTPWSYFSFGIEPAIDLQRPQAGG